MPLTLRNLWRQRAPLLVDGQYLYAVNSFEGTIKGFNVADDGSLTMITAVGGLPLNPFAPLSSGLATREIG